MEDEIGNRIKILIEKENINPQSFANEIGITPGGLNHILTGRNKPRYDILQKIVSKYRNINLDWLLLGNFPMYKGEKTILSPTAESTLFDADSVNSSKTKEIHESKHVKEERIVDKSEKSITAQSSPQFQSFIGELPISEAIDEIRIYFKNKTYLVLKPEK